MPGEIMCNRLYLLRGKKIFTDEMNVLFSTLIGQRSFKSEIQIQNMIHFKTEVHI